MPSELIKYQDNRGLIRLRQEQAGGERLLSLPQVRQVLRSNQEAYTDATP
jgi:hypothetical protein